MAWLDTLDLLVARLADATASHLHLGTYWCSDEPGHSTASMSGRVRSRTPLIGTDSDYWEGAVCYTGGSEGAYADAFLFPFRDGSPVVSSGKLANNAELDQFRWWQLAGGRFVDRGWDHPDGPGEWGWVKKPGDEYRRYVNVQMESATYHAGEPIIVGLSNIGFTNGQRPTPGSSARISLIHANRDKENTNLFPWGGHPPRPNSSYALSIMDLAFQEARLQVDLSRFRIRGGWIPGQYHLSIRVQNGRSPHWTYSSDISPPFKITVSPAMR